MKSYFSTLLLGVMCTLSFGQVNDNFSDGDFTQNPVWTGDVSLWQVNGDQELQSNGNAATESIYLSTVSTLLSETEWRFYVRYSAGGPSSSNKIRFYLASDQADLNGDLNGYFVEVGETGSDDSYDLYRQDGSSTTLLIDGVGGLAGSGIDAVVQVLRDGSGNWTLSVDTGNGVFQSQGTTNDISHTTSSHTGVWVNHTSTRASSFYWDDVYVGPEIIDTDPPELLSLEPVSATELSLSFSEVLSQIEAENTSNYSLNGGIGNPVSAQLGANLSTVTLTLASGLTNNQTYELTYQGISDLAGNSINPPVSQSFTFLIPETPEPGDVILTELMPDPSPSQGLPEGEFVEIYNRSNKVLDLEGWTISDATSSGTLPARIIQPGEYVLIVDASDAGAFASIGPLVSPSSLPSLNNGGDQVILKDATGVTLDSIAYDLDWYQDPAKSDGGFSLELINPMGTACPPAANWSASEATNGGTPGQQNSVYSLDPETEAPSVESFSVSQPTELVICFSEVMDAATLEQAANYQFTPDLGAPTSIVADFNARCVTLTFANSLARGEVYELSLNGITDCSGNPLPENTHIQIARGVIPQPFDVVINEFLPDPEPSQGLPEAEFVELYNRLDKAVELNGFKISDGNSTVYWDDLILLPGEYIILCEDDFAEEFSQYGRTLGLISLPSLNNSGDTLRLLSAFDGVMDYVIYDDDWYADETRTGNGYTLERIDPDFVDCNRGENWAASQSSTGGTPGQENSLRGTFTDDTSPMVQSLAVNGDRVVLLFSEPIDRASLENTANYVADQGIGEPLLAIGRSSLNDAVELLFASPLDTNRSYLLTIDNLQDCSGNLLSTTLTFGIPVAVQPGDILINEVLFNPYTGGADFVEIVNAGSNIVDLQELILAEGFPGTDSVFNGDDVSASSSLLLPGQLLCLTRDVSFQQATYRPIATARFLEMSGFPSYDDREGEVVLMTRDSVIIDRFFYEDDYQYPTLEDDDGVSLERLSLQRPTQDPDNWHSASSLVGYATPGYANSQAQELVEADEEVYLGREVFSPNLDGEADVLPIHYQFDFVGANARVYIYDTRGYLVRRLQENVLLDPAPGVFFWDGFNDDGQKAPMGMYVVTFEVLNDDTGELKAYRKVAVLADKLE